MVELFDLAVPFLDFVVVDEDEGGEGKGAVTEATGVSPGIDGFAALILEGIGSYAATSSWGYQRKQFTDKITMEIVSG